VKQASTWYSIELVRPQTILYKRNCEFGHRYDVWHDRAVFHFLTESLQKQG